MDGAATKLEAALAEIRQEFLETAAERLGRIERLLYSDDPADEDPLLTVYREVHSLKGSGGTFGLASLSLVCHRLEDYLTGLSAIDETGARDVVAFLDLLRDIVEQGEDPTAEALRARLRELPLHRASELDVASPLDIEILLVTPSNAVGRLVARDLRACGCRVTAVDSPWKAIQLTVCTQPDLVITSVVMNGLGGTDLARALGAMAATERIPVAVLTSFSENHRALAGLAPETPVIRMGQAFRDDLTNLLTGIGIA